MKKTTMLVLTAILLAVSIFNTGCNSINDVKNSVQNAAHSSTMSASPMIEENNASKLYEWVTGH